MWDFNTVSNWLLRFEESHLSSASLEKFQVIDTDLNPCGWQQLPNALPDEEVEKAVVSLIEFLEHYTADPLEIPEAYARLARYYMRTDNPDEALASLMKAEQGYQKLSARSEHAKQHFFYPLAVLAWLNGMAAKAMFNTRLATLLWKSALQAFEEIALNSHNQYPIEMAAFCGDKVKWMQVHLLNLPEIAYFDWQDAEESRQWVKRFGGGSHFTDPAKKLNRMLMERLEARDYAAVYMGLERLRGLSQDSLISMDSNLLYGRGDALLSSGMYLLWMGNVEEARKYLTAAATKYLPDTHPRYVARWILGIAYWMPPVQKNAAVDNWQWAIQGFNRLKYEANSKLIKSAYEWYGEQRRRMQLALEVKQVEEFR